MYIYIYIYHQNPHNFSMLLPFLGYGFQPPNTFPPHFSSVSGITVAPTHMAGKSVLVAAGKLLKGTRLRPKAFGGLNWCRISMSSGTWTARDFFVENWGIWSGLDTLW